MKKKFYLLILSVFSFTAFGQFPVPLNFNFSYDYIMIGDAGYCGSNYLIGPAYCSHFSWNMPDTTLTSSSLLYYKVHYRSGTLVWNSIDTTYNTTDTALDLELGVIGWVWVSAVYSNPDGESDSSNVAYNNTLPIDINEMSPNNDNSIVYLQNKKSLIVEDYLRVREIKIFDLTGKCVKSLGCIQREFSVADLKANIYLIEVYEENSKKNSRKILIN